jgi:hypothetical protein
MPSFRLVTNSVLAWSPTAFPPRADPLAAEQPWYLSFSRLSPKRARRDPAKHAVRPAGRFAHGAESRPRTPNLLEDKRHSSTPFPPRADPLAAEQAWRSGGGVKIKFAAFLPL